MYKSTYLRLTRLPFKPRTANLKIKIKTQCTEERKGEGIMIHDFTLSPKIETQFTEEKSRPGNHDCLDELASKESLLVITASTPHQTNQPTNQL